MFPRPINKLRPVVRCCSVRYNTKQRFGKGFSLEELKQAGINPKLARTIGIAVDHRRQNLSEEGLQDNVQRLKAYKSNLVLFPRNPAKVQEGEAKPEEAGKVEQARGPVMPLAPKKPGLEFTNITQDMKDFGAYKMLRQERTNKRLKGMREKRQRQKEAEEKEKMK